MKLVSLLKRDEAPISELKDDGWSHGSSDGEDELDTPEVTLDDTPSRSQNTLYGRASASDNKLGEEKAPTTVVSAAGDEEEDMIVEI